MVFNNLIKSNHMKSCVFYEFGLGPSDYQKNEIEDNSILYLVPEKILFLIVSYLTSCIVVAKMQSMRHLEYNHFQCSMYPIIIQSSRYEACL